MPTPPAPGIRIHLGLTASLWNHLLADALSGVPGLHVIHPDAPGASARPQVLIAATPGDRSGWVRLGQSCRRDGLRVLVLGENRPALVAQALRVGASGYVGWDSPLPLLIKAIRVVHRGDLWAERKIAMSLLRSDASPSAGQLTPRELRVLEFLSQGKRNKEIAVQLAISETTVKSHLNRVYQKLNVSDRLEAALYVERYGVDLPPATSAASSPES